MSNYSKEEDKILEVKYKQCIEQIEILEKLISAHRDVPPMCLGGEMNIMYHKVRDKQLALIRKIYKELTILN